MSELIYRLRESKLKAYEADPGLIKEHFGIEEVVLAGGYGYRQVLELVQNGADAILEAHEACTDQDVPARIEVVLADPYLYVANTGAAFGEEGIDAILRSHSSPKRGNQIGRFGLGFKSLLRLGGKIDIVSGPVAFGFEPDRCRQELRNRFGVRDAPGLRLAWTLDDARAASLRDKFPWATTVVCAEICAEGFPGHLRTEIQKFPSEFLLFLPVPVTLALDDGTGGKRQLHRATDGKDQLLHDGGTTSRWRVVETPVSITDQRAVDDATHIHTRDSVPLSWAMPLDAKREEAGRFWAFFPTHTPTYLPGILNAPWKLNSDRNAIIGGEWNTALMKEAAKLIAATLPQLATEEDFGRPLDAFPRQLERKDDDAAPLVEALWAKLENAPAIPDATGKLRPACELWRHPRDNAELARQWQSLAGTNERGQMIHPSCLEQQRASRLNALAERLKPAEAEVVSCPNLRRREAVQWFSAVASPDTDNAIQVLKLAEAYEKDCKPAEWSPIRPLLAIIPSDDGQLLTASRVVFAPEGTHIPDGRLPVARSLCEKPEVKRILTEVMKVKPLDDEVWEAVLEEALDAIPYSPAEAVEAACQAFWAKLRAAPATVRQEFATENSDRIFVRRCDGEWNVGSRLLLPGALIAPDDARANESVLVDMTTHGEDGALLAAIGVTDCPDDTTSIVRDYSDLSDWRTHCRNMYRSTHQNAASWSYLNPVRLQMPNGWDFLPRLNGLPNARLTERLLTRLGQGEFAETLKFGHSTVASYPKIDVPHPLPSFLLEYGTVQVGGKPVRLSAIVARRGQPALTKLPNWEQIQPTLEKLKDAQPSIHPTPDEIRALWLSLINALVTPDALADDSLRELWAGAAKDGVVPKTIRCSEGEIPLTEVFVTGSPDLARRARTNGRVVVTLDDHALKLWLDKGARNLAELMSPEWTEQTGPPALLVSTVPELDEVMREQIRDTARCQPVVGLKLVIAGQSDPAPCLMWENTLLLDSTQLASLPRAERLKRLVLEVAPSGWLKHDPQEALRILGDAKVDEFRAKVAEGATLPERLLRAVGNRHEPLRQVLGHLATMDFVQRCTPLQLAELVLAQLGPATLPALRTDLEAEGLKPPSRWSTAEARAFVASIGFPEQFAASPEMRREAEEFISGPIELPPLHDFQEEVFEGIRELVTSGTTRRRAVISLPTGGGKTLVTVEAAVLLVLKPVTDRRSVIWIAQTDELCEQAVQSFRQVWLNLGAQKSDLRIVRLWGGNPNPAIQETDVPVVVVASIQTLNSRMGTEGLVWLQNPGLVVVDECHHAITPSYTNLLRWLDAEAPRPGAPPKDEPPILGLSATPFRTDDEESHRLARRFDNLWLPSNQEQLHNRLRRQGVLAQVDNEALESGVGLTPEELERLSALPEPWEGIDFENLLEAINQRLAENKQRNDRLVSRIAAASERSILFFANSVAHAEEMSARINLRGIPAAAVSGRTATAARRYFLERFQRGQIRILCNHSVLSTGFDAPKTDMVFISRAVFSPVRYMQMVGRGLRGEKNGGKARCRMITVLDNLGRFQDKHPYHYCQKYFSDDSSTR